jgi:methylated-DNA-[protein]-cysteine S-methyltransferase
LYKSVKKNREPIFYTSSYESSFGQMVLIATDECLWRVGYPGQCLNLPSMKKDDKNIFLLQARELLNKYFSRQKITIPIPNSVGTPFQKKVWEAISQIPIGETNTYGQISNMLGKPHAARAVGAACAANHFALLVPCHRVIGSRGALGGYAGGLALKRKLLTFESEKLAVF